MADSIPSQLNYGSFIPTTNMWDVTPLYNLKNITPELQELLVRLYQNLNKISIQINLKDTGYYNDQEFLTNNLFFPIATTGKSSSQNLDFRPVFRKIINFGSLPNATTKTVAHGIDVAINTNIIFTRIYGSATNTARTSFIPLPFASPTLNENIKLEITNTNVSITTGIDRTAYTIAYIIVEYIK